MFRGSEFRVYRVFRGLVSSNAYLGFRVRDVL